MSHRSSEFEAILHDAETRLRRLLGIPDDYAVLFLQGGGSLQFAMVPMNLGGAGRTPNIVHTGLWTAKALGEHRKLGAVHLAGSSEAEQFRRIPHPSELRLTGDAAYLYLCSNNTVEGTQWKTFPESGDIPLVADMSSDILSRALDVRRFGLIFAGAQKNLGPAGVTAVIVRKELAERAPEGVPAILQYRAHMKEPSLYHTPPTFAVYLLGLVLEWVEAAGGVAAMAARSAEKARLLYDAIDSSAGFYSCPAEKNDRSLMNVVFRAGGGDAGLEEKLVAEAERAGLAGLKGHRAVGGLRASLYNAVSRDSVAALADFLREFAARHSP